MKSFGKNNSLRHVVVATAMFLCAATLIAQIHTPEEILKILEESSISYGVEIDEEVEPIETKPEQILPGFYMLHTDGKARFGRYELSDEALELYGKAEEFFAAKEFDKAITGYHAVLKKQPDYSSALTMIGDAYFKMEKFDSAQYYLRKAIDLNFIDYQAHWFLSSTELRLGNTAEGLRELTIAHILNPGHELLRTSLKAKRKQHGNAWKEWSFAPRYELNDKSLEEVEVQCAPGWMMYSLTQALWKFEENYTEGMDIEDRESLQAASLREKEATLMFFFEYLTRKDGAERGEGSEEELNTEAADAVGEKLATIIDEGLLDAFVFYEIIGRENPLVFSMISAESAGKIAEYVTKYH